MGLSHSKLKDAEEIIQDQEDHIVWLKSKVNNMETRLEAPMTEQFILSHGLSFTIKPSERQLLRKYSDWVKMFP